MPQLNCFLPCATLSGVSARIGSAGQARMPASWVPEGSGGVWKVLKQGPGYCIVLRSFQVEEKGRVQGRVSTGCGQAST